MIDIDKPIRVVGKDWKVHVAGVLTSPHAGNKDVAIFIKQHDGWQDDFILFSLDNGRCLDRANADLRIENAPVISSGFFPLDGRSTTNARGLVSLMMAKHDYPGVKHFVEIISTDGVPTDAKIHTV